MSAQSAAAHVLDENTPEVSRSYAEALINAAEANGDVDEVLDELGAIGSDVFRAHPDFADLLASPLISEPEKDRILAEAFENRANPTVVRFLRVLNRHGRLGSFFGVLRAAEEIRDQRQNRRQVLVQSAVPLDDSQRDAIRDQLSKSLHATPLLTIEVDPSLLGGLVVQVGDVVYDASIRTRLEQLRQRLIEGKTHEIQSRRDHFRHPA